MIVPSLRRASASALVIGLAALSGCGGGPMYVPVTGTVTVDGKPYSNAVVSFQPVAGPGNPEPGRGSSALTDGEGRFYLMTDDGRDGALVGKHRVRIQTKRDDPEAFFDPHVGSADNAPNPKKKGGKVDPIPTAWYSDKGGKEFDVPPGGTSKADFAIESVKLPAPKSK